MLKFRQKQLALITAIFSLFIIIAGCTLLIYHGSLGDSGMFKPKIKSLDPNNEAKKIHPVVHMKALFNAIKSAERIIFVDPEAAVTSNEQDQIALSVFYPGEKIYWQLINDISTAKKKDTKKIEKGHVYIMRWYKRYKILGEIAFDNKSGIVEVNIPKMVDNSKPDTNKPVYHIFASPEALKRLNKAALFNREKPNIMPDSSTETPVIKI